MRDDVFSQWMREQIPGLPDNFRVYSWEAVGTEDDPKVRLTGALARPETKEENPNSVGRPCWISPMQMKRQKTMSLEQYRALTENKT